MLEEYGFFIEQIAHDVFFIMGGDLRHTEFLFIRNGFGNYFLGNMWKTFRDSFTKFTPGKEIMIFIN